MRPAQLIFPGFLLCCQTTVRIGPTCEAHQMFLRAVPPKLLDIWLHLRTGKTMAHISLDGQTLFTPPVAAEQETTRRNLASVMTRSSQNNAFMISSDEESDYGDLDDGQSDTSFQSIDELRQPAITWLLAPRENCRSKRRPPPAKFSSKFPSNLYFS